MIVRTVQQVEGGRYAWFLLVLMAGVGQLLAVFRHRLYWRFCALVGKCFCPQEATCVLALAPDARMEIQLADPYWSRLVAQSYQYEPDFYRILAYFKDWDYGFLDCGANFGYWSILVTSTALGQKQALAMEASPQTFQHLKANALLNQARFQCVHAALSAVSGKTVCIEAHHGHAGAHIRHHGLSPSAERVETKTLDDIVDRHVKQSPPYWIIKLDVEGEEIPVLEGAARLLAQECLLYYEDHGKDRHCQVTRHILETLGYAIFYCHPNGRLVAVEDIATAIGLKKRRTYGYNFLACRPGTAFWHALRQWAGMATAPTQDPTESELLHTHSCN